MLKTILAHVLSVQLLHECRQHAFQFGGPLVQCVIVLGLDELQIARQQQVIFQLLADPIAMEQQRANSASPLRPHPSARLAAMEEPARRN